MFQVFEDGIVGRLRLFMFCFQEFRFFGTVKTAEQCSSVTVDH
jgi:hypothetical protein